MLSNRFVCFPLRGIKGKVRRTYASNAVGSVLVKGTVAFMFLFITTPGHGYTAGAFVQPLADADVPNCNVTTYNALLGSTHTVKAVHIFTDLERLSDSQLITAARLYRTVRDLGIPCLNDPAMVMGRYQLLCSLFEVGINPFAVYRADGQPKPAQFPVFVRNESDHDGPMSALIRSQDELDDHLKRLVDGGRPLRGLLVVEYAAEPGPDGIWRKVGTHRVGKNYSLHHQILSDNWVVKNYVQHVTSDALQREEKAAIIANHVPENVHRAFAISGIEWGDGTAIRYRGKPFWRRLKESPRIRRLLGNRTKLGS